MESCCKDQNELLYVKHLDKQVTQGRRFINVSCQLWLCLKCAVPKDRWPRVSLESRELGVHPRVPIAKLWGTFSGVLCLNPAEKHAGTCPRPKWNERSVKRSRGEELTVPGPVPHASTTKKTCSNCIQSSKNQDHCCQRAGHKTFLMGCIVFDVTAAREVVPSDLRSNMTTRA